MLSSLKSQQYKTRVAQKTRQVIAFQIREEWFALPIGAVHKVVPMSNTYGDPLGSGMSIMVFQGQELGVLDVERKIFGKPLPQENLLLAPSLTADTDTDTSFSLLPQTETPKIQTPEYLIILQNTQGNIVGLPIDSSPLVRRFPDSSFAPLPNGFVSQTNIQCVHLLIIRADYQPPLFVLNPDQLV